MSDLQQQDQFDQQILNLVNQARVTNGLTPLTLSEKLDAAADLHSQQMAQQDFFSHNNPVTGSSIGSRAREQGYTLTTGRWGVGENIAAGHRTAEIVVAAWLDSPGHRANILNPEFRHLGVGHFFQSDDSGNVNFNRYWTQSFGFGGDPGQYVAEVNTPTVAVSTSNSVERPRISNGTSAGDELAGRTGYDIIRGLSGNDTLRGVSGSDSLDGGRGNDLLIGGADNDRLFGGEHHDILRGGTGDDRLIGVNIRADDSIIGRRERDTLIGNQGRDTFVLGQSGKVFYDDNDDSRAGTGDYALIVGFDQSSGDRILLEGSAEDYVLGRSSRNLPPGTRISLRNDAGPDELIGIVRNTTITSLNGGAFRFV